MINLSSTFMQGRGPSDTLIAYAVMKHREEHALKAVKSVNLQEANLGSEPVKTLLEVLPAYDLEFCVERTQGTVDITDVILTERDADSMIRVVTWAQGGQMDIWGKSPEQVRRVLSRVKELLPKKSELSEADVKFSFWRNSSHGAEDTLRTLQCPSLEEVKYNYPADVMSAVNKIANLEDPVKHGTVILWHGPPGTGKTHMIRALARHWSKKFNTKPEVVLDPEVLFREASYLFDLLMSEYEPFDPEDRDNDRKRGVRLVIIEDHAELFSTGCRQTSGFSRLLNVTDGLLGQGQQTIFLFTANEKIEMVDSALTRSGRALQNLYFPLLNAQDCYAWAEHHGVDLDPEDDVPLSDLFALKNEVKETVEPVSSFGF